MDVGTERSRRRHTHEAPHGHVLADLGNQCPAPLIQCRTLVRQLEQVLQARGRGSQRSRGDGFREGLEFVAAGNEVGLAIDFDERGMVAGSLDRDRAFGRYARGFLVGLRQSALAHQFGRGVQITLRFDERLFALHKSSAGAFAKLLDCICVNVHRILQPPAWAIPHWFEQAAATRPRRALGVVTRHAPERAFPQADVAERWPAAFPPAVYPVHRRRRFQLPLRPMMPRRRRRSARR